MVIVVVVSVLAVVGVISYLGCSRLDERLAQHVGAVKVDRSQTLLALLAILVDREGGSVTIRYSELLQLDRESQVVIEEEHDQVMLTLSKPRKS